MLDSRRKRRHPPHFFKVYLPSFSSKRLKIPTAFLKHMKGVTSGICTIIGPSEKIWNVSLRQHTDECFFEEGWPVFVSDHSVETGDFFVFRYDGDLQFKVQIFGPSTFEKESAFEATCSQHIRVEELEDLTHEADSVTKEAEDLEAEDLEAEDLEAVDLEVVDLEAVDLEVEDLEAEDLEACIYRTPINTLQKGSEKHQGRTKRRYLSWKTDSGSETKHARKQGLSKSQRRCITEEEKARVIEAANTFEKESAFDATCSQHRRVELEDPIHEADSVTKEAEVLEACVYRTPINTLQKGSEKHQGRTKRRYLSWKTDSGSETKHARKQGLSKSQRRCITVEEKARVIETANAFKSKNPFTLVVLRPSYVYHGFWLSLPALFWRSHLSKCDQEMTLWDQSERAWPVKYVISNYRGGFSGGWGAFARHHNLEADDVCIFELTKAKEMRVHVFRAVT